MDLNAVYSELAPLKRWVPYQLAWNPKREKFDKIPHNGLRGISTKAPAKWLTLVEAIDVAQKHALRGVGLVFTDAIDLDGYRLIGFDFDNVDFEHFEFPFDTYAEISVSKTGVRAFAWLPISWAEKYRDTVKSNKDFCDHVELYIGTAPRFLTITLDPLGEVKPISRLTEDELEVLATWLEPVGLLPAKVTVLPTEIGNRVEFKRYVLEPEHRTLLSGETDIDRSAVLHSLLIKLFNEGVNTKDVLATLLDEEPLWQMCLDHRQHNEEKAFTFAQKEVLRAYNRSFAGMQGLIFPTVEETDEPKQRVEIDEEELVFPMELFDNAPGFVGEIARWVLSASYAPREEFAVTAAISMMACLIGPYCSFGSRAGKLNLYLTLIGDTGAGKNEAMDTMCALLAMTEARDCVIDFPASEAGLRRQLNVTPNLLLRVDELAHKFDSMQGSANGSSLGRAVLEAYNGARMPPKVYADERKTLAAVENPYVQILGGSTYKIWDVMKTTHLEDGTLNRFIFVCLPPDPPYRRNLDPTSEPPAGLVKRLNQFWRSGLRYDLLGFVPPGFGRSLTITDEVRVAQEHLDLEAWDLQQKEMGGLYTRYVQNTLKIAAVLAVSEEKSVIELAHFNYGRKFMAWCLANTYHHASMRMADSPFEKLTKRLLDKLRKEGGQMTVRNAYRFLHTARRETEELLATLVLSGQIAVLRDPNKPGTELIKLNADGGN